MTQTYTIFLSLLAVYLVSIAVSFAEIQIIDICPETKCATRYSVHLYIHYTHIACKVHCTYIAKRESRHTESSQSSYLDVCYSMPIPRSLWSGTQNMRSCTLYRPSECLSASCVTLTLVMLSEATQTSKAPSTALNSEAAGLTTRSIDVGLMVMHSTLARPSRVTTIVPALYSKPSTDAFWYAGAVPSTSLTSCVKTASWVHWGDSVLLAIYWLSTAVGAFWR